MASHDDLVDAVSQVHDQLDNINELLHDDCWDEVKDIPGDWIGQLRAAVVPLETVGKAMRQVESAAFDERVTAMRTSMTPDERVAQSQREDREYLTRVFTSKIPGLANEIAELFATIQREGLYESHMWTFNVDEAIESMFRIKGHMARIIATKQRRPIRADGTPILDEWQFVPDAERDEYERVYPYQFPTDTLVEILAAGVDVINRFTDRIMTVVFESADLQTGDPDEDNRIEQSIRMNIMIALTTVRQIVDDVLRQLLDESITVNYDQSPIDDGELLRIVWRHPTDLAR